MLGSRRGLRGRLGRVHLRHPINSGGSVVPHDGPSPAARCARSPGGAPRAQRPSDLPADPTKLKCTLATVSPKWVRRIGRTGDGEALYLVPGIRNAFPGEQRQPSKAVVFYLLNRFGGGGGGLTIHNILDQLLLGSSQPDGRGPSYVYAVVPDGVRSVSLTFEQGIRSHLAVANNAWITSLPAGIENTFAVRSTWFGPGGRVLRRLRSPG